MGIFLDVVGAEAGEAIDNTVAIGWVECLVLEFPFPLPGREWDDIGGLCGASEATKREIACCRYVFRALASTIILSSWKPAIVLSMLLIILVQIITRTCQERSRCCLVAMISVILRGR